MAAPTSALTFQDLILEVALFIGTADYSGGAAAIPTDAHDLAEAKRHVNNGLRMFFNDAPPTGWRFARPTMMFTIYGDIALKATRTVTGGAYDAGNDETILTSTEAIFQPGMEFRNITLTTSGDFKAKRYISSTQMAVIGDASAVAAETFTIANTGNYTLPAEFGGEYTGDITYVADTNQGVTLSWSNEAVIRQWRENITDETGDPYWAAIRPMEDSDGRAARRWEIMFYPKVSGGTDGGDGEVMVVEFPFQLYFDSLVNNIDSSPTPYRHDETLRSAALACAERDTDDSTSTHHQQQYERNLQNSYKIDNRSGPRRLGYFGNPTSPTGNIIETFRNHWYDRPAVSYNTD